MNGRKTEQILNDATFLLARPSFSEMHAVVGQIDAGEVESVLLEAVGEQKDDLQKAINASDHEDVIQFWDDWLEFAGVDTYRKNFVEPREQKALEAQAAIYRAMKDKELISETFLQDLMSQQMTL